MDQEEPPDAIDLPPGMIMFFQYIDLPTQECATWT